MDSQQLVEFASYLSFVCFTLCIYRSPSILRMDSQMRDDAYFTNLLQSGVDTQQSPPEDQMEPIVKKTPRGGNFTVEEDILLISAWLNISMDAIQGNEQKHKTYWIRIEEYFERERKSATRRTPNSLMNRWSLIQLGTNKFCGFLASIESKHQSGVTEQDKVNNGLKVVSIHYCTNILYSLIQFLFVNFVDLSSKGYVSRVQ